MILVGNQRGGAQDLARHLMKDENERVAVHDIRGFVSRDLAGAFLESEAISRGTRCKQHLYSLSLNPPKNANASPEMLVDAVRRAENKLGLSGQPRAIVFHEKRGSDGEIRRHAHAVWCRIVAENMRAVQVSYDRPKLQTVARELYRDHGWQMPRGFVRHEERNPRNFTLAEWQPAKRAGRDPAKLKGMIQDCWMISDSKRSFAVALKENGFILARGDKRGAVAVDHTGEAFPVARAVGVKSKALKDRLGDLNALPSREEAHQQAAKQVADRLSELREDQRQIARQRLERLAAERRASIDHQLKEAQRLKDKQAEKLCAVQEAAQARIRKGWRGLLDRVTGRRNRVEAENKQRLADAMQRSQAEKDNLSAAQEIDRKRYLASAAKIKMQ